MTLFAEHRRRRELAGDARAGRFARGEARRRQYAQARRLWKPLTVFVLVCLAAEGGLATRFRADPFLAGLLVGALTTFLFASMYWLIVQASGTANQMMGASAGPGDYLARVGLLMAAGMTTFWCVASLIKPLGLEAWLAAVCLAPVVLGLAAMRSSGLLRWALTGAFGSLALTGTGSRGSS